VLSCNHHVDVIPAAQAVIEDRQQAVGVRGKVTAHEIGCLVDDVVKKSWVLMGEAVVILLPHMRGQEEVQRRDIASPGQLIADLQPFRMLAEHGVDDANEGFITIEESMPASEKIPLQPTLALVLAQHRVQHAPFGRKEHVIAVLARIPLTVGDLKYGLQKIRDRLIGTEHAKVSFVLIQLGDISQERTQHQRVLNLY